MCHYLRWPEVKEPVHLTKKVRDSISGEAKSIKMTAHGKIVVTMIPHASAISVVEDGHLLRVCHNLVNPRKVSKRFKALSTGQPLENFEGIRKASILDPRIRTMLTPVTLKFWRPIHSLHPRTIYLMDSVGPRLKRMCGLKDVVAKLFWTMDRKLPFCSTHFMSTI